MAIDKLNERMKSINNAQKTYEETKEQTDLLKETRDNIRKLNKLTEKETVKQREFEKSYRAIAKELKKKDLDDERKGELREMLATLKDSAKTEEDIREQRRMDSRLIKTLDGIKGVVGKLGEGISKAGSKAFSLAKLFGVGALGYMFADPEGFKKALNEVITFVFDIPEYINSIVDYIKSFNIEQFVMNAKENVKGFLGPLGDIIDEIILGGAALYVFIKPLRGLIKRLLLPINFLFSALDGLKAAVEEYRESGSIMSAIREGIGTFFGEFFGGVLNVIRDLSVLALEYVGLDNAAKWVSELDGVKLVKKVFDHWLDSTIVAFKEIFNFISSIIPTKEDIIDLLPKSVLKFVGVEDDTLDAKERRRLTAELADVEGQLALPQSERDKTGFLGFGGRATTDELLERQNALRAQLSSMADSNITRKVPASAVGLMEMQNELEQTKAEIEAAKQAQIIASSTDNRQTTNVANSSQVSIQQTSFPDDGRHRNMQSILGRG